MRDLLAGKWDRALLLEYVFLEVVTVLMVRRSVAVASAVATILMQARELEFVACSDLFLDALATFQSQGEAGLSFTDAAIITVAQRFRSSCIATFDSDFRKIHGVSVVPAGSR